MTCHFPVPSDPGEKVTVRFRDTPYYTEADGTGKWHVMLPPQQPGGPFLMEVNEKVIRDRCVEETGHLPQRAFGEEALRAY